MRALRAILVCGAVGIALAASIESASAATAYTDLTGKIVVEFQSIECVDGINPSDPSLCSATGRYTNCTYGPSSSAGECQLAVNGYFPGKTIRVACVPMAGSGVRCRQDASDTTVLPPNFWISYQQP